jgi:hypothetical protein
MRLARMGASHQTRLSFLRALLRRVARERWRFDRPRFEICHEGYGTAIYRAEMPSGIVSLVCFSTPLAPERRTDRVIAEAWDTSYALVEGEPDEAAIERLRANVPRQEAGRYEATELVLARANRSVRLFDAVVEALAAGRQPERRAIESVGYLMRTTAVYGNGKFGIADREVVVRHPELAGPFRAEMLAVWLIRSFTLDLVEHVAKARGGTRAVTIDPALRRRFGIGNATGLGMAPFLVKHPTLIGRWIEARETALARVRGEKDATPEQLARFSEALARARAALALWQTDDPVQASRIIALAHDLASLSGALGTPQRSFDGIGGLWDQIYRFAEARLSAEAQEMVVSLLLEPHGELVDDLADSMAIDETREHPVDGLMTCGTLARIIDRHYAWVRELDFSTASASARFWYASEEKLEPRLGERASEPGAEREQPLAIARDVVLLRRALEEPHAAMPVAGLISAHPELRHTVRRVQITSRHPFAEIEDNLIAADMRPIDLLRSKLAFFGATRFDPRSDKWLRITLFQGAPFPEEVMDAPALADDVWAFGPADAV